MKLQVMPTQWSMPLYEEDLPVLSMWAASLVDRYRAIN